MAVLGTVFAVLATLSGMFLLAAVEGGFLAEGFFLLVLSWVFLVVFLTQLSRWVRGKGEKREEWP
jgi:hypothetical protein